MSLKIPLKYYLSSKENPVNKELPIWDELLPLSRKHHQNAVDPSVTYGGYFSTVSTFLEKNNFAMLASAFSQQVGLDISIAKSIHVFLEKHGEFYHPARVKVECGDQAALYVINTAVSDSGNNIIEQEYNSLKRLNHEYDLGYVPKVHGYEEISCDNNCFRMFLGEWFEGYHEFHISFQLNGKQGIIVWDHEKEKTFLSEAEALGLYAQASRILTLYYNIETFEQIFPWHHAAGDFVLKKLDEKIDLKLITVRQYAPLFVEKEEMSQDFQSILEALLVFFLNLSIRIRLDRMDGVGDVVWADDIAVKGTVQGFFNALEDKDKKGTIPFPVAESFYSFFTQVYSAGDIYTLAEDIADTYPQESPELLVIKKNLEKHVADLYRSVSRKQKIGLIAED